MQPANAIPPAGDEFLIREIRRGRGDLVDELLRRHMPVLMRFVRSKMGNDPEAEDVVQQTVLKAFKGLDRFEFRSNFRTWLFRIAINEILGRRRLRSRTVILDELTIADFPAPESVSPLKQVERAETVDLVRNAVRKLARKYRMVLRLRDLENLSLRETARILNLSLPAVKTRHFRARRKMLRYLAPALARNARLWGSKSCNFKKEKEIMK